MRRDRVVGGRRWPDGRGPRIIVCVVATGGRKAAVNKRIDEMRKISQ